MDEAQAKSIDLLIESYYRVAAHLREIGEANLRTAELLAVTADKLSEEKMRAHPTSAPHE
jgi:hypothetical protein